MILSLEGRKALITGGSKGLGRATALAFAAAGADVAIVARDNSTLQTTAAALRAAAPASRIVPVSADVATAGGCAAAVEAAAHGLGHVDILVNNAGVSRAMPFLDVDDSAWAADFDLKLFAAVRLARLVLPGMRERRWGRVINVLNIGAKAPNPNSAPTSVTRAAGMALTKVLAHENAPFNVLVNALLVGLIDSDQWVRRHAADQRNIAYAEFAAEMGRPVPLGRIGKAEEFAATALFLASDAGGYITGTAINVDGGRSPVV